MARHPLKQIHRTPRPARLAVKTRGLSNRSGLIPTLVIILAWALPLAWVGSIPRHGAEWQGARRTDQRIEIVKKTITKFTQKYDEAPRTLGEIRAFARAAAKDPAPLALHDAYGARFEYLRLGKKDFFLRSFGPDARQNTVLTDPDPGFVSWSPSSESTVRHAFLRPEAVVPGPYAAVYLAGVDSPSRLWTAKLFSDRGQVARRLVLRHLGEDRLVLIAPHDGVEEFLWLPNGYQIVYTATGSQRYRDGIYVWNLLSDTTTNLLDVLGRGDKATIAPQSKDWYLSLAGVTLPGPVVNILAVPATKGVLDPKEFFAPDSLVRVIIPESLSPPRLADDSNSPSQDWTKVPWMRRFDLARGLAPDARGNALQRQWLALPVKGDAEASLASWQDWAIRNPDSPIVPYALFYLCHLYHDAWQLLTKPFPEDSEVLRAFGDEIAGKLLDDPLAPRYLRAMGLFFQEHFSSAKAIGMTVSELTLPNKAAQGWPAGVTGVKRPSPAPSNKPQGRKP